MARFIKILGFLALLAASAAVGYYWNQPAAPEKGLEINFKAPEKITSVLPFSLELLVLNRTQGVLENAEITLTLPPGLVFLGKDPDRNFEIRDLGNLGGGGLYRQSFQLLALAAGEEDGGVQKTARAVVNYSPRNLTSRFEEAADFDLAIEPADFELELTAPAKVLSGESLTLGIKYKNNSPVDFEDLVLSLETPPDFSLKKPKKTIWELGRVRPGTAEELNATGNLIGPEKKVYDFNLTLKGQWEGKSYLLLRRRKEIAIDASPITLTVSTGDASGAIRPGDALVYTISYDAGSEHFQETSLEVQLTGELFDFDTVEGGQFNPATRTIVFREIPPDRDVVSFRVKTKPDFSIRRIGDKNFLLRVDVRAKADGQTAVARSETRVAGRVFVKTIGFFRDASSGILNNGPWPPRVGQGTQFTVHWRLINTATDVKNIEVRTLLPPNVRFVAANQSDTGLKPVYNELSRELIWRVERLLATSGSLDKPPEAVFQIESVPAPEQAGQFLPLVGETQIIADDEFTGLRLTGVAPPLTSALPDDPTVGQSGLVLQ